jgi:hypothetical protein
LSEVLHLFSPLNMGPRSYSLHFFQIQFQIREDTQQQTVQKLKNILWRPYNFTPTHSLTGPVGQLFASCLGGQRFASWGCTKIHNKTGFLLLALSCYIGDPDVIDHWPHPRLRADNGKLH